MDTARFAAKIVALEIALVVALGVLLGTVGLQFGDVSIDVVGVATFLAIVGAVAGIVATVVTRRRQIAEGAQAAASSGARSVAAGARSVAEEPEPVVGIAVVVVLAVGTVAVGIAMVGPTLLGFIVAGAVAAALLAGLLYAGPRSVVDRPWTVAGAFLGAVAVLFVVGVVVGPSDLSVGGFGLAPQPVLLVLLTVGAVAGAAFGAYRKREQVRRGAEVVAENRYPVLGGVVGGIVLVFVALVVLGFVSIRFGGIGVIPGPIIIVAVVLAVVVGAAYAGRWYRQRDEGDDAGEQAEA